MIQRSFEWYGWRRDTPDFRDFLYKPTLVAAQSKLDNRDTDWGIYDQGNIGSCTANASISAYRNLLRREGKPDFNGSRLAQYYWSRYIEGASTSDSGAEIRDAVKVLNRFGVAPESDWPYIESKVLRGPPHKVSVDSKKHIALKYQSVMLSQNSICSAVSQNGNVIIGISVYDSFESDVVANTGVIPLPQTTEQLLGGHAIEIIGYDTTVSTPIAIVKNSWGTSWGDKGYCYIPFSYLTNPRLSADFWTLSVVS